MGADWLACDLNSYPASERGASLPLLPAPFSSRHSSLGFKKERAPLSPGRESLLQQAFHSWSGPNYFRKCPSPLLPCLGHCCWFWEQGLLPSKLWGRRLLPLLGALRGIPEVSVFLESDLSCQLQGNRKKAQLIIFYIAIQTSLKTHLY